MGRTTWIKRAGWSVAGAGVGGLLLLPWWRNHALLRDFYDYGNIIAGVGRMQLGERPYVDFWTPIQTLPFWVGGLAERVWGESYLSLTYAAAFFTVGVFALMAGLLARPLGGGLALLVAAGVTMASAGQHTIVWYNAMGVAWLAVAMWVAPQIGRGERAKAAGLCAAALWLGGMTKLTYQGAALAFVLLWLTRAAGRELGWARAAVLGVAALGLGVVAPVATEMASTGASFAQWKKNVLGLAASRVELLAPIGTWKFYWHTPHDYHQPMYFPFVGAWGVALTLVVAGAAAWKLARAEGTRRREWAFLMVASGGVLACGLAFQALHLEIAYVAGAGWLVLATGLVLAFVPRAAEGPSRVARGGLGVAAVTLLVPAWISAWAGARAIWSQRPLVRSELVSTDDLPARFGYVRGMRILPEWHASLQKLERVRAELAREGIDESAWYFVNGTEWLVRAMPEARHRGLPLWLQGGTTFGAADLPEIVRRIERGTEIKVIVSHHPWAFWAPEIGKILETRYEPIDVGPAFKALRVRSELDWPLQFAERFDSNLYSRDLDGRGGALEMHGRADAPFLGAHESAQLVLQRGVYRLSGSLVAERAGEAEGPVAVKFRIRKMEGPDAGGLLWGEEVVLTREISASVRPFAVSPGGARVALEVELPEGSGAVAGWRGLQVQHAGEDVEPLPMAVSAGLPEERLEGRRRAALLAENEAAGEIVMRGEARAEGEVLAMKVPGEIWVRLRNSDTRMSGEFRVGMSSPGGVRVVVAQHKAGRFERLFDERVKAMGDVADGAVHRFDVPVRERGGWVVLLAVASEEGAEVRWSKVSGR